MRELPVKLPPHALERRGGAWREIVFFVISFAATFGGAWLLLCLLS